MNYLFSGKHFSKHYRIFLLIFHAFFCGLHFVGARVAVQEQDLTGEIEGGNYTYYRLKNDFSGTSAAVVLLLFSKDGDADLYVSFSNNHPTFSAGQHDFQSTTCGVDRVEINLNSADHFTDTIFRKTATKTFAQTQRPPVTVGVYGHPSYPISHFSLRVLLFVDDGYSTKDENDLKNEYFDEEIENLARADRWREWVQQIAVTDDDIFSSAHFSSEDGEGRRHVKDGINEWLKSIGEILLTILGFVLNLLVEILQN